MAFAQNFIQVSWAGTILKVLTNSSPPPPPPQKLFFESRGTFCASEVCFPVAKCLTSAMKVCRATLMIALGSNIRVQVLSPTYNFRAKWFGRWCGQLCQLSLVRCCHPLSVSCDCGSLHCRDVDNLIGKITRLYQQEIHIAFSRPIGNPAVLQVCSFSPHCSERMQSTD